MNKISFIGLHLLLITSVLFGQDFILKATNPEYSNINGGMIAAIFDKELINDGTITGGHEFIFSPTDKNYIGMYGSGNVNFNFINNGIIEIDSPHDTAFGMFTEGTDVTLENTGSIVVTSIDAAAGMFAEGHGGTFINSGSITSTGYGAYGIVVGGSGNFILENTGSMNITATDTTVIGFSISSDGNHSLINSGDIVATGKSANVLYAAGYGNHTINNSGTITVNVDQYGYGLFAEGDKAHTITNSGDIFLTSTNGSATGILFEDTLNNLEHIVHNTGNVFISAKNGKAFEVYGTSYNVGTYATTLRNWTSNDAVFGVKTGGIINFSDSTIILRPGTKEQGFVVGKEYKIQDMSYDYDGNPATITGSIDNIIVEVPFLKGVITGDNAASSKFSLESNVTEKTTPGGTSVIQSFNSAKGQMSAISNQLFKGIKNIDDSWNIVLTPYVDYVNNTEYLYTGSNYGATLTGTHRLGEALSIGGHFGIKGAHYDADILEMGVNLTSLAFGLHTNYTVFPNFWVRNQTTGMFSQTTGTYAINDQYASNTQYNNYAWIFALDTGYEFNVIDNHALTSEIGIHYLGMNTSDYSINWQDSFSIYNMDYNGSLYNSLFGNAKLNWESKWILKNNNALALNATVGITQNFLGDSIETKIKAFDEEFTIQSAIDATSFTADATLDFSKQDNGFSFGYNGIYSTKSISHGGNMTFWFTL